MHPANGGFQPGLVHSALTDVGMRRSNNQDSHGFVVADNEAQWQQRGHLFLVADGMGAHAAGELASKMATEGISHRYLKYLDLSPPEALKQAIEETNAEIHRRGEANPEFHQMGTTCSVLALLPQGAVLAHVGDSRVYRVRGTRVEQLTFDHSLQWELKAAGQLPAGAEFSGAIPKNVITRSLGPSAKVQVDLEGPLPVELEDRFLLCSDGLTGKVDDDELGAILLALPPEKAGQLLIDLANLRGGPDNITCVIAEVTSPHVTTTQAAATPILMGAVTHKGSSSAVLWVVVAVAALIAVVMLLQGNLLVAAIAGGLAAVGMLIGIVRMQGSITGGVTLGQGRRLGRGPYVAVTAAVTPAMTEKLKEITTELSEAAEEGGWPVNWEAFRAFVRRGAQLVTQGQYLPAIKEYGQAISFMMEELRKQNARGGDSWIQY